MDVENAEQFRAFDDEQRGDLVLVEQFQSIVDQRSRRHRLGIVGHEIGGFMLEAAFDVPAEVAIGDHADKFAALIDDPDQAQALRAHFDNDVVNRAPRA